MDKHIIADRGIWNDTFCSIDSKKLNKQFLPINQKMYISTVLCSPNGQLARVIGNSRFVDMENKIDRERAYIQALQRALILAQRRFGFGTGTYLIKVSDWGLLTPPNVTTRRVQHKGGDRTQVYVQSDSRRGVALSVDYEKNNLDFSLIDVADEEGFYNPIDSDVWRV